MAAVVGGIQPRISPSPRLGLMATTKLWANQYAADGASGNTYLLQTGSEDPFDWLRFVYANGTASAYTIGEAAVAASSLAPTNGYSAYKADGTTTQAFTTVTFNAGGAAGLPPSPSGSAGTLVVPARLAAAVPSIVFSDWMQVSSIPPADGGTFHYVLCRTGITSGTLGGIVATPISKLSTDWPTIFANRKLKSHYSVGTIAQVPNSLTGNQGRICPIAVQFYSRKRGLTLVDIGDSLTQGLYSTSDHNGPAFQAMKLVSTPAAPVFVVNQGYSGQLSADFYTNGKNAVDNYAPDVAAISIFSPNDGTPTQASCDASFARALDFAHYCITKGTVPIIKTAIPWAATDTTTDPFRISINTRARALAPGILVADFDAAVTDGATPARIASAYSAGDGTHLNDAGYGACAATFVPILRRVWAAAGIS